MFQPENEYYFLAGRAPPDPEYAAIWVRQARDHGILVPLHSNDGNETEYTRVIEPPSEDNPDILVSTVHLGQVIKLDGLTHLSRAMTTTLLVLTA